MSPLGSYSRDSPGSCGSDPTDSRHRVPYRVPAVSQSAYLVFYNPAPDPVRTYFIIQHLSCPRRIKDVPAFAIQYNSRDYIHSCSPPSTRVVEQIVASLHHGDSCKRCGRSACRSAMNPVDVGRQSRQSKLDSVPGRDRHAAYRP